MRYAVYKALDKKNSLFGIRGSYQKYALYGLGVAVFVGLFVGTTFNSLVGTVLAIVLGAGVYAGVLAIQAKYSEKERTKWFCSKKLPGYILVPPKRLRKYVRLRISERNEKRGETMDPEEGIDLKRILSIMEDEKIRIKKKEDSEKDPINNNVE